MKWWSEKVEINIYTHRGEERREKDLIIINLIAINLLQQFNTNVKINTKFVNINTLSLNKTKQNKTKYTMSMKSYLIIIITLFIYLFIFEILIKKKIYKKRKRVKLYYNCNA